jgi:NAD(P)-dependent dehydrogenase (short-subunit alcohol dehydrogenase family)
VQLPIYPFQRKKYWVDRPKNKNIGKSQDVFHPLVGKPSVDSAIHTDDLNFNSIVNLDVCPYVSQHLVYGNMLLPGSGFIEMGISLSFEYLVKRQLNNSSFVIQNFLIEQPLALISNNSRELQIVLQLSDTQESKVSYMMQIFSRAINETSNMEMLPNMQWTKHASAEIDVKPLLNHEEKNTLDDIELIKNRCFRELLPTTMYEKLAGGGLDYGVEFQGVKKLFLNDTESLGIVEISNDLDTRGYFFHPALLDACFQVMGMGAVFEDEDESSTEKKMYLPFEIKEIRFFKAPGKKVWVHAVKQGSDNDKMITADINIYNESGDLLLQIKSFHMVLAPKKDLELKIRNQNLNEFDLSFYQPVWKQQELQPINISVPDTFEGKKRAWILFVSDENFGDKFSQSLNNETETIFLIIPDFSDLGASNQDVHYEEKSERCYVLKRNTKAAFSQLIDHLLNVLKSEMVDKLFIMYMWCLDVENKEIDCLADQHKIYLSALFLMQALFKNQSSNLRLYVITRGAQKVELDQNLLYPNQSILWGLGRTFALENSNIGCRLLDLDPSLDAPSEKNFSMVINEANAGDLEDQVVFRNNDRFVRRLERIVLFPSERTECMIFPEFTYIITGGLGGLGFCMAEFIISKGAKDIVLIGRHDPSQIVNEKIQMLSKAGANITITLLDVSNAAEIKSLFDSLVLSDKKNIKGIIHCAGSIDSAPFLEQDWEKYLKVMSPKVLGAVNLQKAIEEFGLQLDFFISFSSTSSILGNIGQANYAAANSFLDTFAQYQRLNGIQSQVINWGAWEGVGLAAREIASKDKDLLSSLGMRAIDPLEGVMAFENTLQHRDKVQICFTKMDWERYLINFSSNINRSFFSGLIKEKSIHKTSFESTDKSELIDSLQQADVNSRMEIMSTYLQKQIADILGLEESSSINITTGFMSMGIDSIMSIELQKRLKQDLGGELKSSITTTLLFNHSTIESLSTYFIDKLFVNEQPMPTIISNVRVNDKIMEDSELEKLSEQQLEDEVDKILNEINKDADQNLRG